MGGFLDPDGARSTKQPDFLHLKIYILQVPSAAFDHVGSAGTASRHEIPGMGQLH